MEKKRRKTTIEAIRELPTEGKIRDQVVYSFVRGRDGWEYMRAFIDPNDIEVIDTKGPHDIDTALALMERDVMRQAEGVERLGANAGDVRF